MHSRAGATGVTRKIQLARRSNGSANTTRVPTTASTIITILAANSDVSAPRHGSPFPYRRSFQQKDRERETDSQIERQNYAMLPAAYQCAHAELPDRGLHPAAETAAASRTGATQA